MANKKPEQPETKLDTSNGIPLRTFRFFGHTIPDGPLHGLSGAALSSRTMEGLWFTSIIARPEGVFVFCNSERDEETGQGIGAPRVFVFTPTGHGEVLL